jgi:hypothetical protein
MQILGNINCASPTTNTNGNSTVLLPGPWASNPTSLPADYRLPAPNGKWLDFKGINAKLGSSSALTDLNVTFNAGPNTNAGFVHARCNDNPMRLNMRAIFNYVAPIGIQTVNTQQVCS